MLASPHAEWCLKEHKDREYRSEAEAKFFAAIESPEPPTQALKDLLRDYRKKFSADHP
jgi:hypothetical protein